MTPVGYSLKLRVVWAAVAAGVLLGASACSQEAADQSSNAGVDAGEQPDTDAGDPSDNTRWGDVGGDADRPDRNSGEEWEWEEGELQLHAVIPSRGPLEGGTRVEVTGTGLSDSTELLFGGQPVDAEISQGRLVAHTPPAPTAGPVTVRAVSAQGQEVSLPQGFTYADPVRIDEIFPTRLPAHGGVEIDIEGAGFTDEMGVSFNGDSASRIDVVDEQIARVVVPAVPPGEADVRVTVPHDVAVAEQAVYFYEPLSIDRVEPAAGSVNGGDEVTLKGEGFDEETTVYFGGAQAAVQSVDPDAGHLVVTTPAGAEPGEVDVEVHSEHDVARLDDGFTYDDGVSRAVYSIQPSTAEVGTETEHLVSGRGLDEADTELVIGDTQATILESGPASALVELPAAAEPGFADVVLEQNGQQVDRLDDALEYLSRLEVDTVDPQTGDAQGGEQVTISGEGLQAVEQVRFGGLAAQFEVDGDELKATTPAAEPGVVDVVVDTGERQRRLEEGFEFETDAEIWSMHPSRGAIAGGTHVTLQGRGFGDDVDIQVGQLSGEHAHRLDPYSVSFSTPAMDTTGEQPVTAQTGGDQTEAPYPFVYFDPTATFGGAWGPPVDGAVNVTVLGVDGTPIEGAFVMLSNNPDTDFQGVTDDNGQITLSGPEVIGPQTIHATAADLSTYTVRELDAQNLTVVLNPLEPDDPDPGEIPPPPIAYFEGEVTISGKTPDPTGGDIEINMTRVHTTTNAIGRRGMPPGDHNVVEGGEGHYEVRSGVGDFAVVALCGFHDEADDSFTPKLMGVERNLSVGDGERVEVDLDCDIPLDSTLPLRLTDPVEAPEGPTQNRVQPFLDFGYDGVLQMPEPTVGTDDILQVGPLPAPEGEIADLEFAAVVGSFTGSGMPLTRTTVTSIQDVEQLVVTPPLVGVPDLLAPEDGDVVDDHIRLGLKGTNEPDFHHLTLVNQMGMPAWTFMVPGEDEFIPMPEFPSFSDMPAEQRPDPYQPGQMLATGYGPRVPGFDYNAFSFHDLHSDNWSAYAVDSWVFSLVE